MDLDKSEQSIFSELLPVHFAKNNLKCSKQLNIILIVRKKGNMVFYFKASYKLSNEEYSNFRLHAPRWWKNY